MTEYARFFAAMWLSEGWYDWWRREGPLHAKTRAMVVFDRIMSGQEDRIPGEGDGLGGKA